MLTITFPDGTVVDICKHVITKIHKYEQNRIWKSEAGGVLVGKKHITSEHYTITDISTPTVYDKRSRFSFVRDVRSAQPFINKKWEESNGITNYVGEWHTHPEAIPTPSSVDVNLIKQVVSDKTSPFTKVFLIIYGLDHTLYIGIAQNTLPGTIHTSQQIEVDYEHL